MRVTIQRLRYWRERRTRDDPEGQRRDFFSTAARTVTGIARQAHSRACSSCQRTRSSIVGFFGILFLACQSLFRFIRVKSAPISVESARYASAPATISSAISSSPSPRISLQRTPCARRGAGPARGAPRCLRQDGRRAVVRAAPGSGWSR